MPKRTSRIDREASDALRRIETQMRLEGKLDKADAAEGAAILFAPLLLGVVGLVGWVLTSLGLEGPEMVVVAVFVIVGSGALIFCLADRR
jgi:cation transporter-like permease